MMRIETMFMRFGTMHLMRVQTMLMRFENNVDEIWDNIID